MPTDNQLTLAILDLLKKKQSGGAISGDLEKIKSILTPKKAEINKRPEWLDSFNNLKDTHDELRLAVMRLSTDMNRMESMCKNMEKNHMTMHQMMNSMMMEIKKIKERPIEKIIIKKDKGGPVGGGGGSTVEPVFTLTGTVNGVNTVFTVADGKPTFRENAEMVFLNGSLLDRGSGNDYTVSADRRTFTMAVAPAVGSKAPMITGLI